MAEQHTNDISRNLSTAVDWSGWLRRWDVQQSGYLPDREARFTAIRGYAGAVR